jgi:nucleotide-binding universal stress UspA family protein
MFKKILVCLDGSELAEKILPYAVQEATHFESELVLFRVFSESGLISLAVPGIPGIQVNPGSVEQRVIEDEKQIEEYLKRLASELQADKSLRITCDSRRGSAGPVIVEYSAANQIELVAIATHGRSGPGRVVLGSVADYVIRHSNLPLLLIRPLKH